MSKYLRVIYSRAPAVRLRTPTCRVMSTLGDTLKGKEHFEENRFIRQKEEQQISAMRQEMEETRRMRKELYDQVVLDNTMEDLKHILAGEKISAEAMQRLAEWKTGL